MNNLITVKNLHVLKNGKFILQDINFTIDWQDRVAILGPNGAGKSFLLRVLSADLVPSFGSYVEIFGKVFGKTKLSDLRSQIGFVSSRQLHWFSNKDTLWQVVASGIDGVYGASREFSSHEVKLITESLDRFGILEIKDRLFDVLSDGEKRRALLARSLVKKPKLLILDEPAIGLDIPTRVKFLETLDQLSLNLPIIYVTHHLEELPRTINKILFLKEGKLIAQGSKADMLTSDNLSKLLDMEVEVVLKNDKYFILHN
jgi:iron complex transport system ATP-binding protein